MIADDFAAIAAAARALKAPAISRTPGLLMPVRVLTPDPGAEVVLYEYDAFGRERVAQRHPAQFQSELNHDLPSGLLRRTALHGEVKVRVPVVIRRMEALVPLLGRGAPRTVFPLDRDGAFGRSMERAPLILGRGDTLTLNIRLRLDA